MRLQLHYPHMMPWRYSLPIRVVADEVPPVDTIRRVETVREAAAESNTVRLDHHGVVADFFSAVCFRIVVGIVIPFICPQPHAYFR